MLPQVLQSRISVISFIDSSGEQIVFETKPTIYHTRIAFDTVAVTSLVSGQT